jgi:flagellar basal body rod protein FlgG
MTVDASAGALFDRVAARERDAQRAFMPGALPENDDVASTDDAASASNNARADDARAVSDPLSVGLPQNAFVVAVDERGNMLYTRDGSFHLQDGTLVDASGRAVQGYRQQNAPLAPIELDRIDRGLDRVNDVRVEVDGRLTYARTVVDPRSGERVQQRVTAGRIALARFPAGTALHPLDSIHAGSTGDVVPHIGMPGDGSFGSLEPSRLTRSHIDLDASLIKLKESYLVFDALRAARQVNASTQKTATDLIK